MDNLNRYVMNEDIPMAHEHTKNVQHHSLLDKCKLKP